MPEQDMFEEFVRDPELTVVRVETTRVRGSSRSRTAVEWPGTKPREVRVYGEGEDWSAGHRAVCRAVRLGLPVEEERG